MKKTVFDLLFVTNSLIWVIIPEYGPTAIVSHHDSITPSLVYIWFSKTSPLRCGGTNCYESYESCFELLYLSHPRSVVSALIHRTHLK